MSFKERVIWRAENPESFSPLKNIVHVYQSLTNNNHRIRPKVYHVINFKNINNIDNQSLNSRLPNIYVVRPSLYIGANMDTFVRDDIDSLYDCDKQVSINHNDFFNKQIEQLEKIRNFFPQEGSPSLIFEEFVLCSRYLQYPVHYYMHMFGDKVGLIQAYHDGKHTWFDTSAEVIHSTHGTTSVDFMKPTVEEIENMTKVAATIAKNSALPYLRVDMVSALRGPLVRGVSYAPGDVRSKPFADFYDKHDKRLAELWDEQERALDGKNKKSTEKEPTVVDAPIFDNI